MKTVNSLRIKIRTVKKMQAEFKAKTLVDTEIEDFGVLIDEMRELAEEYVSEVSRSLLVSTMNKHMGVATGIDVPVEDVRQTAKDCLQNDGDQVITWLEHLIEEDE